MTNFIRYKDEIINLDLVAIINKSYCVDTDDLDRKKTYNIIFYGANNAQICCLEFDDKEIRDKTFDDICFTIAYSLNCSLHSITEINNYKNLT